MREFNESLGGESENFLLSFYLLDICESYVGVWNIYVKLYWFNQFEPNKLLKDIQFLYNSICVTKLDQRS